MEFSPGAVKELLEDLSDIEGLKSRSSEVMDRAMELAQLKEREVVGAEDVDRAVEQLTDD